MKIKGFHVRVAALRTLEPFVMSLGTLTLCHTLILFLETDEGTVGIGEAAPAPRITGETISSVSAALSEYLLPPLKGKDPSAIEEIHEVMERSIHGNYTAKAAVDLALHDLAGKHLGRSALLLLGGKKKDLVSDYTIGMKPPEEAAARARTWVSKGFRILKVKVGGDHREDVERIRAIREAVGEKIPIRVDANQGWSPSQAVEAIKQMQEWGIELVEQPVPAHDLKGMVFVRNHVQIPVAADESVHTSRDAVKAVEAGACDVMNIKLMKCGGIHEATKIAAVAREANLSCMIGGMVGESGVAVTAASLFASATPTVKYYDLDADLLLQDHLVKEGGITVQNGEWILPDSPGLGITSFHEQFFLS